MSAAREHNVDNRVAVLTIAQRSSETTQARMRALPSLSVTAGIQYNQYNVQFDLPGAGGQSRTVVITPQVQANATVQLSVPVLNASGWQQIAVADTQEQSARVRAQLTGQDVKKLVARAWFTLAASDAVVDAARRAVQASVLNRDTLAQREGAGLSSTLDVERAEAEVARNTQTLAEAQYSRAVTARTLETLTGLAPTPEPPALDTQLGDEEPLESFLPDASTQPAVRAAQADVRAAEQNVAAAWYALVPTVSATATETLTNAVAFGYPASYALGLQLSWRADLSTPAAVSAARTAAAIARVREGGALQTTRDEIQSDWLGVQSALARSRAARAQEAATKHASQLAKSRFEQGTATQLDVIQAERDAFQAEVSRIQADVDLHYARALLRIAAGRALGETP